MATVWILDDSPMMHRLLEHQLHRLGCQARSFCEPRDLHRAIRTCDAGNRPCAMLVDLNLGEQSGLDVLGPIRNTGFAGTLALITGTLDDSTREMAQAAGADVCLSKPIELKVLEAMIQLASRRAA